MDEIVGLNRRAIRDLAISATHLRLATSRRVSGLLGGSEVGNAHRSAHISEHKGEAPSLVKWFFWHSLTREQFADG